MEQILGSLVPKTVVVWLDVEKVVRVLRGQVNSIPGFGAVKREASIVGLVSCARSEVVVLSRVSPVQPLLPSWVVLVARNPK